MCAFLPSLPSNSSNTSLISRAVFSLIIINKAGGLIYNRQFASGLSTTLTTNDYLVLAGTFHGVHAITKSLTPRLSLPSTGPSSNPSSPTTSTPKGSSTLPNPQFPPSGIEVLETTMFRLTCFQTVTGTKFLLFTDPLMPNVDLVVRGVYERYADYVMKNPFYSLEMPIRCEAFDRSLGGWIRGRG